MLYPGSTPAHYGDSFLPGGRYLVEHNGFNPELKRKSRITPRRGIEPFNWPPPGANQLSTRSQPGIFREIGPAHGISPTRGSTDPHDNPGTAKS